MTKAKTRVDRQGPRTTDFSLHPREMVGSPRESGITGFWKMDLRLPRDGGHESIHYFAWQSRIARQRSLRGCRHLDVQHRGGERVDKRSGDRGMGEQPD